MVSRSNNSRPLARGQTECSPIRHAHARQATSAHSVHGSRPGSTAIQVSTPEPYTGRVTTKGVRPPTRTGLHDRRVGFPMPLGNALRPQARGVRASRPAPTPNWAFAAGTRGFTAMPFKGFLGPSSEAADLTRILRRRSAGPVYHILPEYSREYSGFSYIFTGYSQTWRLTRCGRRKFPQDAVGHSGCSSPPFSGGKQSGPLSPVPFTASENITSEFKIRK